MTKLATSEEKGAGHRIGRLNEHFELAKRYLRECDDIMKLIDEQETIKESSTRLDALQDELVRLQSDNSTLSETVSTLRAQIVLLQRENAQLERNSTGNLDCDNFDMSAMDPESLNETLLTAQLKPELSNDSGIFDVSSSARQASQSQLDSKGVAPTTRGGQQAAAAMIAEAIMDAATGLKPR
jgi:predicted nuclease with TOPRIM domain